MVELQYLDPAVGGAWDDVLLAPMAELNAEILEAVAAGAVPAGGQGLQWRWQALGAPARQRLAGTPFLLVDAGFAQTGRWAGLPHAGVHDASPLPPLPRQHSPLPTPLLLRVLMFAWHLARSHRLGARVALGMSAPCAALIGGSRLADLEALAIARPPWIQPRWNSQPEFWSALLAAAAEPSIQPLQRLHLWGLQSIAAEVTLRAP